MNSSLDSLLLTNLSWTEVRDRLAQDGRLIVPLGARAPHGPPRPIGPAPLVTEAFARQLSPDLAVLRAPIIHCGVNVPAEACYPGAATLREKSLHALLNDLLGSWEDDGFREFIVLTVHDYDSHVEAAATITTSGARLRVIELLNIDFSGFGIMATDSEHGGEVLTSLMLHLYPQLVRMERAVDYLPVDRSVSTLRRSQPIPAGSPGSLGRPTRASAETGRTLYDHIYAKIHTRLSAPAE